MMVVLVTFVWYIKYMNKIAIFTSFLLYIYTSPPLPSSPVTGVGVVLMYLLVVII